MKIEEGDLIVFQTGSVKIPLQVTEVQDDGLGKVQIYKENNLINFKHLDDKVDVSVYKQSKFSTDTTCIKKQTFLDGNPFC